MVFILDLGTHGRSPRLRIFEQNTHTAGVAPVLGVHFAGLVDGGETEGRYCVDDCPGEWVRDRLVFSDAPALGAGAGGVEVEGVEALVVFVLFGVVGPLWVLGLEVVDVGLAGLRLGFGGGF